MAAPRARAVAVPHPGPLELYALQVRLGCALPFFAFPWLRLWVDAFWPRSRP
jgi:hypothetical protein